MTRIDAALIRHVLIARPQRGALGLIAGLGAAIASCEIRTMGMGLYRSDGRLAGIVDPILMHLAQILHLAMPIL